MRENNGELRKVQVASVYITLFNISLVVSFVVSIDLGERHATHATHARACLSGHLTGHLTAHAHLTHAHGAHVVHGLNLGCIDCAQGVQIVQLLHLLS